MSARVRPHTDDQILAAVKANEGDLKKAASSLHRPLATIIKRLRKQPLRGRYRGLILLMAGGNVSLAAKHLGLSRQHLYKLINPDHECFVQAVGDGWAEGRETRLDMAESQLDENIAKGNEASIFFLLKTLGKSRGYVERQEITSADGQQIKHTVEIVFVKPGKQNGPTPRETD